MKDELFEELASSVREGGEILRGLCPSSRTFNVRWSALDGHDAKEWGAEIRLRGVEILAPSIDAREPSP
jgi:hypothetical protein